MSRTKRFRLPVLAAASTAIALCIAGPASAHIHADPSAVEAGTETTVGFAVEHGCDASPTTQMEIQLPDGATGIKGVDEAGFTSSVDGQVVTFSGGSVPDGTEQAFKVTFTAPDTPGEAPVKIIQTCEEGSLEWIEVQAEGEAEPEHPAPLIDVTAGTPDQADAEHGHDEETSSGEHAEAGADGEHGAQDQAAAGDEPAGHDEEAAAPAASPTKDDDDGSSAPLIIGIVAAIVVVGGGGAFYARSRKTT